MLPEEVAEPVDVARGQRRKQLPRDAPFEVHHDGFGDVFDAPPGAVHAETEVDVLGSVEDVLVEESDLVERARRISWQAPIT